AGRGPSRPRLHQARMNPVTLSGLQTIDRPAPRFPAGRVQPAAPAAVGICMETRAHTHALPMELLRPYLLIACIAFAAGFVAFVALGRSAASQALTSEAWPAPASTPAASVEIPQGTYV